MLKQVVIFCALLAFAMAYVGTEQLLPIPEKYKGQQGCYMRHVDKVIPFGSTSPSKEGCLEYLCGPDYIRVSGCGVVGVSPPCYMVTDDTKPFPNCCPMPKCPTKN